MATYCGDYYDGYYNEPRTIGQGDVWAPGCLFRGDTALRFRGAKAPWAKRLRGLGG